jgi:hypothetical protein
VLKSTNKECWKVHYGGEAVSKEGEGVLYLVLQGGALTEEKRKLAVKVCYALNKLENDELDVESKGDL